MYHGTHKKIARTAAAQYHDHQCHHVPYAQHQPGDLVFFEKGSDIHHVAIISGPGKMIEAPHTGANVSNKIQEVLYTNSYLNTNFRFMKLLSVLLNEWQMLLDAFKLSF